MKLFVVCSGLSTFGSLNSRRLFLRCSLPRLPSVSATSFGSRLRRLSTSERRLLEEYTLDEVELFMREFRIGNGLRLLWLPGTLDTLYDELERCRVKFGAE